MKWLGSLWLTVALGLALPVAGAASVPWVDERYSHFSDQEPLADMLKTLAAFQGIPIVVSPKVKDVVSLHFQEKFPEDIFLEVAKTYGLIWYYDKEALYVYKEDEVQSGSVSLKKLSPVEFTNALKRLEVLDERFQWSVSEVDNMIYLKGPERFVSAVLDMAQVMDTQTLARQQVYRWKDKEGVVNFSSENPVSHAGAAWNVQTEEKFPGFVVVDVVKNKK